MRLLPLILLAALALPGVPAQGETNATNETSAGNETAANETTTTGTPTTPAPVAFTLLGYAEGNSFYWTLEGQTQRNPTLVVPPGAEVTITVVSASGFHNLEVEGIGTSEYVDEGQRTTFTFTAPTTEGDLKYWCVPHKGGGMGGIVRVSSSPASGGAPAGAGDTITGETVDLGSLGYPECQGTQVPAAVTRGVAGAPVLSDYVQACKSGGSGVAAARPAHGADYVIPLSIALLGLGVVGMVWVHRYYKP